MMDGIDAFTALHVPGEPLVLYNIWDAGSARAVAAAGAKAIATGSWGVAEANGFSDGETLPLEIAALLLRCLSSEPSERPTALYAATAIRRTAA